MKYTIHNIYHKIDDFDDDAIRMRFDIHFTEPEEMLVTDYFFGLDRLLYFIKDKHPEYYDYYSKTRRSIDTWGPAERQTLEAMGEEATTQLYGYLEEYLLTCDWMGGLFEQQKNLSSMSTQQQEKQQEGAAKIVKTLSEGFGGMKEDTRRSRQFCNNANKQLREIALAAYPQIANLAPEKLKAFQYFFVDDILSMSRKLDKLMYENRK